MTVEEIRLENLKLLISEFGSAAKVAQLSGTAPAYLSQIINRVKSRTGKPRDIGPELARKLESGCGKTKGWMDENFRSEIVSHEDRQFIDLARRMSQEDKQTWLKVGASFAKTTKIEPINNNRLGESDHHDRAVASEPEIRSSKDESRSGEK